MNLNDILYSTYNGTPFELIEIKSHISNKGIFGLESHWNSYILKNLNTNKKTELVDEHIEELFKV